jgi:hypothetical protein
MAALNSENQTGGSESALPMAAKIAFLLAVAVVIFLLARACSNNKTQLENTRATMLREKDSLLKEMKKTQDDFNSVQTEKDNLARSLEKETGDNKQLQAEKAASQWQLGKSNKKIAEQKDHINSLNGKNDSLLSVMNGLQSKMADLNSKINDCNKDNDAKKLSINMLNDTIGKREAEINRINEAMKEQHRIDSLKLQPKFVYGAGLLAGYGLNVKNIPYSHYFAGPDVFAGMEFRRRFLAGIGTGVHIFNGGTLMPLFLEFRYGFEEKKNTPFIYSRGGPLLHFGSYDLSNLFLNAGIGVRHQISENSAYNLGVGIYSHNSGTSGRDSFIEAEFGLIFSKKEPKPAK